MKPSLHVLKRWAGVGCTLWLAMQPAGAQSLVQLYQAALANNPALAVRELETTRAQAEADVAGSRLKPQLNTQANLSGNHYHDGLAGTANYVGQRVSLNARQPLIDTATTLRHQAAQVGVRRSEYELTQARMGVGADLLDRYLAALQAQDGLVAIGGERDAVQRQVERLRVMRERQLAKLTDLTEAQAYASSLATRRVDLENQREVALARLREISGLTVARPAPLTRRQFDALGPSAEPLIARALQQNANLKALEQALLVAQLALESVRAEKRPTLTLVGSGTYADQGFDNRRQSPYRSVSVGVELQVPLYQGGRYEAAVRESEARQHILAKQLEGLRRELTRETHTAWLSARANHARMASSDEEVAAREQAVQALERGFELGANTVIELLDGRQKLLQSRAEQAKARYDFVRDQATLAWRMGELNEARLGEIANWFAASALN